MYDIRLLVEHHTSEVRLTSKKYPSRLCVSSRLCVQQKAAGKKLVLQNAQASPTSFSP
jgi:hypothetical protein